MTINLGSSRKKQKPRGRPQFGFFIFDCPSDHEVNGSILSESDTVKSVLSNRNLGSRLKCITCTTADTFRDIPTRGYSGVKYVHLAGHGSKNGLGFIGGTLGWLEVSGKLTKLFPILKNDDQRILTLSCCYSGDGVTTMSKSLQKHFTAAYHFVPDEISFASAMTTWSMFYLKKNLKHPHAKIADSINDFMGQKIVKFVDILNA